MIAIVVTFDILHDDFDITTASLLEVGDKIIDKIQSILQFKKAKNISKYTIGGIRDLVITFRNNKRKANSHKEYFNCHKLDHYSRSCFCLNKRFQQPNLSLYSGNNLYQQYRDKMNRLYTSKNNSSKNDS